MKNTTKIIAIITSAVLSSQLFADTGNTTTTTPLPNASLSTESTARLATTSESDATLVSGVQAKIAQESSLKGYNISVTSQDGIVTLSGTLNSQEQVDTALDAARSIDGVADVKSNLIVKHAS